MLAALREYVVGVNTNIAFLMDVIAHLISRPEDIHGFYPEFWLETQTGKIERACVPSIAAHGLPRGLSRSREL